MAKKIVNPDFNIAGMSPLRIYKQFRLYLKMPYIAIAEGPGYDCIFQLFKLHTIGRLMVVLEVKYPVVYKWVIRIRNSLVFRYNHYKNSIRNKFSKN